MQKLYAVYMLAGKRNGTLYAGIASNLAKRIWEHREGPMPGFTKTYRVEILVYYEIFEDANEAIRREKRPKKYKREWKINLIQKDNVEWRDLFETL